MGEVAISLFEQSVEPVIRVREHIAREGNPFADKAGRSQRHYQAFRRLFSLGELYQPAVDDLAARQAKILEARHSKPDQDPSSKVRPQRGLGVRFRTHSLTSLLAVASVGAETLSTIVPERAARSQCTCGVNMIQPPPVQSARLLEELILGRSSEVYLRRLSTTARIRRCASGENHVSCHTSSSVRREISEGLLKPILEQESLKISRYAELEPLSDRFMVRTFPISLHSE